MRYRFGWPARAVALCLLISQGSGALGDVVAAPKHIRQSLQEFVKDKAKVTALIRGIAVMKQRDGAAKESAEYRTSWEYWSAIHGYPGKTSPSGMVDDYEKRLAQRSFFPGIACISSFSNAY